ncbi:MAG: Demethylmenaquinone methyltransferase [Candidatus Hydrogenedentes bacterium ADurb.Bin101]|nr:MAG: Demethylmenaquinone methyltransferase [Candidatus Hydrogenedentes bacterium ADurb.Bin101]
MAQPLQNNIPAIRAFFDQLAGHWDATVSPRHGERLERILRRLPIAAGERVLDVGCGTGILFPMLAKRVGETGCIASVDLSHAMLLKTSTRIAGVMPRPASLLLEADITLSPFRKGVFDWVFCNSCFPHFEDQRGACDVMAGLLQPGGRLVICHSESREAINALHRSVGGIVGGHELPDDGTFRTMVRRAGLVLESLEDREDAFLLIARA